jgi:hypothetical protein
LWFLGSTSSSSYHMPPLPVLCGLSLWHWLLRPASGSHHGQRQECPGHRPPWVLTRTTTLCQRPWRTRWSQRGPLRTQWRKKGHLTSHRTTHGGQRMAPAGPHGQGAGGGCGGRNKCLGATGSVSRLENLGVILGVLTGCMESTQFFRLGPGRASLALLPWGRSPLEQPLTKVIPQ